MFNIKLQHIQSDNLPSFACADLGAFNLIGKNKIKNTGIKAVVIMEDRLPDFFIGYNKYISNQDTTLNRHGPFKILSTQADLKALVDELHQQEIKVFLGFWGQIMDPHKKCCHHWLDQHKNLWRLHQENKNNYDLDPLIELELEKISFAQFIIDQFKKLKKDFDFDGLFLGDGLNGYRIFKNPTLYEDQEHRQNDWTEFYKQIASQLHQINCQLLAYDCLGLPPEKAILHGSNYLAQAEAGLDYLIVQTYPTAWGKKWLKSFSGYDFKSSLNTLKKTKEKLSQSNCQVFYTLEMGDSVEGWNNSYWTTRKQLKKYQPFANGKLLVWANNLFFSILK